MSAGGESRIPGVNKEKRRSLLPAPKAHSKLPTCGSGIPQPGQSVGEPRFSSREPSCESQASSEARSTSSSRGSKEGSPSPESKFVIGDRVVIAGVKPGVLRYFGRTHFAEGEWCGIELDEPEGKNDGTVEQVRYFITDAGFGIFAPRDKVSLLSLEGAAATKEAGVKREASTERVSRLKHPKTSQLAKPQSRSNSPDVAKDTPPKFQSKLSKPRAIVKPLPSTAKDDEKENEAGKNSSEVQGTTKPSKLPLGKVQGKRENKSSRKSGIPQPGSNRHSLNSTYNVASDDDDEIPTVTTPSRVDTITALTLAYDLTDSSGSDSDNKYKLQLDLEKRSTQSEPSLNSPLPDLLITSHAKRIPSEHDVGGEAMSESDDDNIDPMTLSTISHASSLGLLDDDELCNTSLLSHDIKKAIIAKETGIVDPDTLDLLERQLDDEISGIATPEHDMSSSTISDKQLSSSPEPDANMDKTYIIPDIVDEIRISPTDQPNKETVGGEKMATPSSSDNSPEMEADATFTVEHSHSSDSVKGSKEDIKSESSSRNSSKRSSVYNIIDDLEEYPKQKRMVEEDGSAPSSGCASPGNISRHSSTLELAKVAVSQYADLVRSAEEEKVRHQARRSLTSSRGSSRSSSRDSISSSPAREPMAESLPKDELLKKLEMPQAMAISVESDMTCSIDSSMTLSVRSGDITEEPMEIDAQNIRQHVRAKDNDAYQDVMMSSVHDECGNIKGNDNDNTQTLNDNDIANEIMATLQEYRMTRERTFTISTISEESSNMEDSVTSLSESGKPTIPGPNRDGTFTIEEKPTDEIDGAADADNAENQNVHENSVTVNKDTNKTYDKDTANTGSNITFDKDIAYSDSNQTFDKDIDANETYYKDITNVDANQTYDKDIDANQTYDKDIDANQTYDRDTMEKVVDESLKPAKTNDLQVVCIKDNDEILEDETESSLMDMSNVKESETEEIEYDKNSTQDINHKTANLNFVSDRINAEESVISTDVCVEEKRLTDDYSKANTKETVCVAGMVHDDNTNEACPKVETLTNTDVSMDIKAWNPQTADTQVASQSESGQMEANQKEGISKTDTKFVKSHTDILETSVDDIEASTINAEVLKDVRLLKSQIAAMTESAEAQQLLKDLQAGHAKQGRTRERPVSLISDTSVDTGLGTDLGASLQSSVSARPSRPTSSLLSSTFSIDTGFTESELGTLTTNSPDETSKKWIDSVAMTTIPDMLEDCSLDTEKLAEASITPIADAEPSRVEANTPDHAGSSSNPHRLKAGDAETSHEDDDEELANVTPHHGGHDDLMSDVRQTSTPVKEMKCKESSEPMDIGETSDRWSPVLPLHVEAKVEQDRSHDVSQFEESKVDISEDMDVDVKESETSHQSEISIRESESKDEDEMELDKDAEADHDMDATEESVDVTKESIDIDDSMQSVDDDAESSIKKDEGHSEKSKKDENVTKPTKKAKDDKENEKAKVPRGRAVDKKKPVASASKAEKPKVLRRTNSASAATEVDKTRTIKTVTKKEIGKPDTKKPKVGSRIAEYIKSPTSDSGKDAKENENNSKFSKNIVNKKKADIISNVDKKVTVNMVRRASAPVPKLDLNASLRSNGPKSARSEKEEENTAKKTVKRSPPKSKWSNIMTQINEATDKKPAARTTPPAKPAVKSKLSTPATSRTGSASPRAATTPNRPLAAKTAAAKSSTTDKPSNRTGSIPRSRPQAKPTNKTTASLRDERSPSADSHISSISQVSSQASRTSKTATTTRDSTPERGGMVQRMGKRQSMSAVETTTTKQSRLEERRASLAAASRLPAGSKRDAGKGTGPAAARTAANQNRNKAGKPATIKRGASTDKADGPSKPPGPVAQQEITRLEALCEARTKELNYTKMQLKARITSFEAMTTLVKYMTDELDAFACPRVTAELTRVKHHLEQASSQLGVLEREKNSLAEQVATLKAQHAAEREMLVMEHHKSIGALEERLRTEATNQVQQVIDKHSHEVTTLRNFHERNLSEMKNTYEKSITEKDKERDAKMSELKKEHELYITDLQKQHQNKLEEITARFENIKVTLLDKVELLRRECEEMRQREKTYIEQCQRDSDAKLQMVMAPYRSLPAEIDSLKMVIDMRNQEIHDLRRRNLELETQRDELLAAKDKIRNLQQQKENLEAIIAMKAEYEKQLTEKHQVLMRRYDKEAKANKRLSMDKEELTWRLSQSEYTMSSNSLSGSPDVMRRTISHSPTSPSPTVIMSSSLPDTSGVMMRRKKSPSALIPSPRTPDNYRNSGEHSPRTSTPNSGPHSPPKSPRDKEKTNLKRSGTYDLLDREDLEIDMKQSDV